MKTLLLMRHAKSSWKAHELSDFERPLNKRGRGDAPRMGKLLRQHDLVPDCIITSSARRARQTADAVAEACAFEHDIIEQASLYLGAPEDYLAVLSALPASVERALAIGHNPGIEELVSDLAGDSHSMPTGAVAVFNLPIADWGQIGDSDEAGLVAFWVPREIP